MTTTQKQQAENERQEAIELLRHAFPIGSTVHTVVRHVSSSGMQRAISVLLAATFSGQDEIRDVSGWVADATGRKMHPRSQGVKCDGTGMDMAFDLVYSLSRVLYDDGYALNHRNI